MFGKTFDYWLLRPLTHRRNRASEADLDARSRAARPADYDAAVSKLGKLAARFGGRFPVDANRSYLDLGCGGGELTTALVRLGARDVTGVDFVPRRIEEALANAKRLELANALQFVCADLRTWVPPRRYDVLVSHNAFEHIGEPAAFLEMMARFVAPRGIAVLSFGPLFHSPFGDHMWDFFRVQLPWRGALFSEEALMRLRRECFRPTDGATRMRDVTGGLNQMRLSQFKRYVAQAGWRFHYLSLNQSLAKWPRLKRLSDVLGQSPAADYFAHCVDAVLVRPDQAPGRSGELPEAVEPMARFRRSGQRPSRGAARQRSAS